MKQPTTTLILLFIALLTPLTAHVQCPPFIIILETQADVDDFVYEYPNCTSTNGSIWIGHSNLNLPASDIFDLSGLSSIKRINGQLILIHTNSIEQFAGLDSLQFVSEDVWIRQNQKLKNLDNFRNLDTIGGGLSIVGNDSLSDISGIGNLIHLQYGIHLIQNKNLLSLTGLEFIQKLNGWLVLHELPLLTTLKGLENLEEVTKTINISKSGLSSLSGLDSLKRIGDDLWIKENLRLQNISGLENLDSIGNNLEIFENDILSDCQSICNLLTQSQVGGNTSIMSNAVGCNSVQEIINQECISSTISQQKENIFFEISPNPAESFVHIQPQFASPLNVQICLLNSFGQVLYSKTHTDSSQTSSLKIDIKHLSSGVYFINIRNKLQSLTKSIVVQH